MKDFTLKVYQELLEAFIETGYSCLTFRDFVRDPEVAGRRVVILRHDVDRRPHQAVDMAHLEYDLGISSTYYFRVVPGTFDGDLINAIAELGHEIGYHYEDLSLARGDVDQAIQLFENNLRRFRELQPIDTICMHGSPLSRWDNRAIWDYFDYREFGIIGEPYLDVDFKKVLYVTDTGRAWNSDRYSLRDKVHSQHPKTFGDSSQLKASIRSGELPPNVMVNTHPERWSNNRFVWGREWMLQSLKNRVKYALGLLSRTD